MRVEEGVRAFLEENHAAFMSTLKADDTIHTARVGIGLVDGRLWSSGTQTRIRTKHVRRDPRATLSVIGPDGYRWLGLETIVTILDGPDAPELNLALYRTLRGDPDDVDEYLQAMRDEQRLIYEFDIRRAYGGY